MMIPVRCTSDPRKIEGGSFNVRTEATDRLTSLALSRGFLRGTFLFLFVMLFSVWGIGQTTRTWLPTSGGVWTTAANWSPAGVPAATDTVVINSAQSAAITAIPATSISGLIVTGSVSLEASGQNSDFTVSGYLFVAEGVNLTLGTGRMHLNLSAGARGNIQGVVTQNSSGSAKTFTCAGDLTIGPNGYVDGNGNFLLTNTATLRIGSVNGIVAGTVVSGNIRNTGSRTFDVAAAYVYNGVAAQVTGDGLPTGLTNSLTIDNPATVTLSAARTLLTGSLNLNQGTFIAANLLSIGNSTTAANVTINRSEGSMTGNLQGNNWYSVNYTGNSKNSGQELSGAGFRNMSLNLVNGQSLTLSASRIVPGTLTLTSGLINTGNFVINLTGSLSGGNSGSYINGNLQRSIAAGANTYLYPIGTASVYAPVTMNFAASTVAGSLTGSTSDGDHSLIGLSEINSYRSVNRTWQFTVNSGLTSVNYSGIFNWAAQDQDANFDYQQAILGRITGFSWTYPTVSAKNTTSIEAGGITGFGQFQVGKQCVNTSISSQPVGGSICEGAFMELTVGATGEGTLTYQWRKDGNDIDGATASSLTVNETGLYSVVVTGECRSAVSDEVEVSINLATSITTGPVGAIICPGESHELSVDAIGQGTLSYQWRKNDVDIPGATSGTYSATEEGNYSVSVTGLCGTVASGSVFVKLNKATAIVSQPAGGAVCSGEELTLRVNADGEGQLSYQWKKDGVAIDGATDLSYTVTQQGQYTVVVTGACGSVESSAAALVVNPLTSISSQPLNKTVTYGSDASFGLQADGTGELTYMWMVNAGSSWTQVTQGGVFGPSTVAELDLVNPSVSYDGYQFKCVVSGACGEAESDAVTLNVNKAVLTVTADEKRKVYGDENPEWTVSYSGFVRSESLSNSGVSGAAAISTEVTQATPAGTYPIVPSQGTISALNYRFEFQTGYIIIDKANLTVSAVDKSKIYGTSNPVLTVTYEGFVNGETLETSDVTGTPLIQTTATNLSSVGVYDITVDAGSLSSGNYRFTFTDGSLNIGKATITVSADDKVKVYGASNPELTATYSGFANGQTLQTSGITGTPVLSTPVNTASGAGEYAINVAIGTLASSNYDFVMDNGAFTVNKAVITVSAEDKSKIYGAENPALTVVYSGFVNGEVYLSSGITGAASLSTTATQASGVGVYDIIASAGTLSSSNYSFEYQNGKLNVGKAIITVKADDKNKVYGEENPAFTASYSGFVNGETMATSGLSGIPSLSTSANAQSGVGTYDINIAEGTLVSSNYDFELEAGKLSVSKAVIKVTADDKSRIYGEENPSFTATYSGFLNGENLATSGISGTPSFNTDATNTSDAGNYTISVSEGTLQASNYSFEFEAGKLSIGKATVTITADDKSKKYGEVNPDFTATYSGFKNGESLATSGIIGTPSLTTLASASTGAGEYAIVAGAGTLASGNYDFNFVDGKLRINKAVVVITADDKSRKYGEANPVFTASYAGFVNGENFASSGISGAPSMSSDANLESPVGKYDINIAAGTLAADNYTFELAGGKLTISQAVITVTANDASRIYGQANPQFTVSYSGFLNGQTLASSGITGAPSFTTDATEASDAGNYSINVAAGTLASANYTFAFESGKLTIGKATVTITANDNSRKYGEANPDFTATYSGFVNGETLATSGITGAPSLTTSATATSTVGQYDITATTGSLSSTNYSFQFQTGKLTVNKASVLVKADDKVKVFGDPNPALTASYIGLANGETYATSGITGTPAMSTDASLNSPVGLYDITITSGTLASANYDFNFESGKLNVTRAIITVTAENKVKVYGQSNPELTFTYSGFRQGESLSNSDLTGLPVISTVANSTSASGTYDIIVAAGTLASSNYEFEFKNGTLTIQKATLKITADDKSRSYGEQNPQWTVTYSGFVNGETLATSGISGSPELSTPATVSSPAGVYPVAVSEGSLLSTNYTFQFENGKLNIEKVLIVITADDKTKVYGEENPAFTASYFGFVNGETLSTSDITGSPEFYAAVDRSAAVGQYPISLRPGTLASSNYNFTYLDGSLSVTKAVVTITADDKSKVYGEANPVLTASYSGFVNGETLASSGISGVPALNTSAGVASGVGNYAINASTGSLASDNYTFEFKAGKLAITKATILISADDKSRIYGTANPQFTATYNGFVNGETLATSGVSGTPSLSTEATSSSPVGSYVIVASTGTLASENYSFSFVNGKLSVSKAVITVKADDKTKIYGQENPALTASYTGFVNGENFSSSGVTGQPLLSSAVTATTAVGAYEILAVQGTLSSSNYDFTFEKGTLSVTKAVIIVTAEDKSRPYGAANPTFTVTYNGFVNGESLASSGISGTPALSTTANAGSAAGEYTIDVVKGTLASSNYDFDLIDGKLTITKGIVRVVAVDTFRLYGAADPVFKAVYEGLANGETLASSGITGSPSFTTDATVLSPVDVYTLTPGLGTLVSTNYQFEFVSGKFNVGKTTVTVKADAASRPYGQQNPAFSATISGFVNGETLATSGITGQPAYATSATQTSPVGAYDINISVGTLFSHNYTFSYEIGTLNVTKAVITVKADDKSRAYGVANPAFTASYNGFMNGETLASSGITGQPEFSTTATISSEAGVYDITVGAGTLAASNYSFSFESGKLTIGRNIITVTAERKSRKYGEANPEFTYTFNGFLNGETLATSGISGQPILTSSASASSPVGTYDILVSKGTLQSDNYEFSFVKGALQVDKAIITVTPVDASRVYGAPNPSFTATYSGFVNGETLATSGISGTPSLTTAAGSTSSVGNYAIDGAIGTLTASNYEFIFAKGNLQVTKAQLTVTADDKTRPYGSANPVFTASYNGFVNGETAMTAGIQGQASFVTSAELTSPVGQYAIEISSGTLAADNYTFVFVNGKLNVSKATITVSADNKSRLYGASNPALTISYNGFVNGENFASSGITGSAVAATAATSLSPAGQYDITASAGTLAASNYDFNFVKGTLTVNKVTLTVTIDNKTRAYGAADPVFTAVFNGFVNGDTYATSGITGAAAFTTTAVAVSPVGTYDINGATGTLVSNNYDFNFVKGTLQVTKAMITVKADNIDKPYGADMPVLTASYIGLANGETFATSGITGSPVLNTTATAVSPMGTYPISISMGTLQSSNYSFTLESGTLTIGRAVITVTADNKARTYGENNPVLTYTLSGFVNGETFATSGVSGTPVVSTNANVMTDAGDHDIIVTAGTLSSSNYDFKFVKGVLTINKAMLTVTPENKSRAYGAPDPAFTYTYSGFVFGELLFSSGISGTPVITTTATVNSPVGYYDINASVGTLFSPNYNFTFAKGTLTIGKATVVVRANDASRAYGSPNPTFTASYNGFVNGETLANSGITGAPSMTTSANAASLVGTYDIQTGLGTLDAANYIFSFAKGTLTVTKATINVIAEDKSRLYWEDDPALTYTFNGFVNGETLASSGISGQPELSTDVIPYSNAGNYPIFITAGTLASSKYNFNMVNGTFTVRKRTLTVTPDNKSRAYGQANPVFTATYSGFVAGENYVSSVTGSPSYTTTASATSPIGSYDINASVGTLAAENYDFVFGKGTLTIGKAVITVRADNKNKLYGATNPAMTATYSGFMNGETLATSDVKGTPVFATTANLLSPVGDYPITIAQGTLASDNYTFQFVNANLAVIKATIIVTADDKSKVYGSPNPALSVSYSGFVNGETLATSGVTGTPVITTAVTTSSDAGMYDITASLGSLTSNNYLFIFIKGKLTVQKATITVTPDNKWRVYGEQNPVFTAAYSGFINGETLATSGITGAPALTTLATSASGAGAYDITAALGTLVSTNYTFEFAKGTLNIGKATITVTPDNKSRIYGISNPELTATYTGFVNGENMATSGITGTPAITTSANISSPAGSYDINASSGSLSSGNYDFVYSKGTLTIGKATVTVTADNKSKVYGAVNPVFTASYSGFANGETFASSGITGAPQLATSADALSAVGSYDITASIGTLSAVNYDFVFVKGTLTIGKAVITVSAESKGRLYAQPNPAFTVLYTGFVNGEALATSGITGSPSITTIATIQSPAGEYAIVPAIGTLASSNYEFAFENGKLLVGKVTINVIADNKTRPYASSNPELTYTYAGFVNGESLATSGITGVPTISTTAITSSPMGVYPITVTVGSLSAVNYDFNFVLGTLTVGKASLTVTADNKSRTYGASNPTLTYVISGFVNGETLGTSGVTGIPSLSTSANALSPVGTYDITPVLGTLVSSKYDFVFVKGTMSVEKAVINVTADNKNRAYGDVNPEFSASFSGFVNGENLASSGITGVASMNTSATTASPAGNYTINTAIGNLASGNYKFNLINGVLTVGKATITVTADEKNRIYGSANPLLTASYSGFVNGESYATSGITGTPTIQTTAVMLSPVGAYDISISSGSLLAANYDFRFVNGKLNIGKATIIITPDNKSRIYGDANPVFTASYRGFVNGEVLSTSGITGAPALSTMATALSPAGEYFIYGAKGTLAAANYDFSFENGVLSIGKATITVTADNKSRLFGQQNPAMTATFSGFKNGESLATSDITGVAALTTSAVATSTVGNYPITAAKGSLASGNYEFIYVNGVLTVGKATITITADDKSRIYGASNPAFTATYNGFVNGESLATSGITGGPELTTTATAGSAVGKYDINIASGTLTSVNYDFNLVKGSLTINKAVVTVTADNKSRIYGAANPDFTATYNGFVNGETLAGSGITGVPQFATPAVATSPVGTYDITVSAGTLASSNYSFTFAKGTLAIEKATIVVTADDKSRKYGENNPVFTASYAGFVNGETYASSGITGTPSLVTVAVANSTAGTYEITAAIGSLASANYTFNFRSGLLTIGKAMITVTADDKSRIYGSVNPEFTASYTGYVNGETWATSGILGAPAMTTVATSSSAVGTYPIVPTTATLFSPNYDFTFVAGVLTVNKALITVTADDKSRGYGEANPVLTASYSGFVNGEDLASSDVAGSPWLNTTATQTSALGTYPISAAKGSLLSGNYDFVMVNGVLTIGGPVCNVSGTLVVADNCYGSKISLTYINSSFAGPYTLTINDSVYTNVFSGVPFVTAAVAKSAPESIWSSSVIGEEPVNAVTTAIEAGVKFRPNVQGQITGIRFYKRSANTGTHVGSLWTVDGVLLARATFTNETASGWQQVNFNAPVTVTPGQVYVASYYSPKGNVAYKSNAFTSSRVTNPTGSLTALKGNEGGNGIYKMGAGFPNQVSSDNGNYYVDVVFNNAESISRFNMTSIISAAGCATLSESVQALDVKMQPLTGVSIVKQDPICLDGADGSITLTAIGCNAPYSFSIDNGSTYSSSASFSNLAVGTYQIKVKDASNFIKDTSIVLGIETAIWTGELSTDWHNGVNWSTGRVPSAKTHVIIPFTARECYITAQDVTVSSIQVRQGAIFRALDNRRVIIAGTCTVLPSE